MEHIASFDIGSNAIRMATASLDKDGLLVIRERIRKPLRLGTEAFSNGTFSENTIEEAVRVFCEFRKILDHHGIQKWRAVATSAFRNAANREVLRERVLKESGIFIEEINGTEEAYLIRKAIQTQIDLHKKNYLLFDIGGGSAELTFLEKGELKGSISLPMGTVRLLQIAKDASESGMEADEAFNTYLSEVSPLIEEFARQFSPQVRPIRVVGTGGNFRRLSRLRKKVLGKSSVRYILPDEVAQIREIIEDTPFLKRMKKFGLRHDRADVIVPAIYIIEKVMGIIPVKKIIAPDIGLVHGILFEMGGEQIERVQQKVGP